LLLIKIQTRFWLLARRPCKYMKKPMDPKLMEQYMQVAQEGMNWVTQWNSKLYYCASKEKYQKRFDEISEKAEKKLKELGLE
jgi:hypothetical protein